MNELELAGSHLELRLIQAGYKALSTYEKNELTALLANRENLPYTDITETFILEHAKSIKLNILASQCEEDILSGFEATNGHTYRTNRDDQVNMIGQYNYLLANPDETDVMWKTQDAGYVDHPRADWLAVYSEGFVAKKNKLYKFDTLKQQVASAKTDEELVAIVWS